MNDRRIILPGEAGDPRTPSERDRDNAYAQRFFPLIVALVNRFSTDNPGSAHGVMVAIVTMGVRAGKLIGMQRGDWSEFTRQVWEHEERGGFGRGS